MRGVFDTVCVSQHTQAVCKAATDVTVLAVDKADIKVRADMGEGGPTNAAS